MLDFRSWPQADSAGKQLHFFLDKLLIETDGPVRFSRCFELKPAQISFLSSVVFEIYTEFPEHRYRRMKVDLKSKKWLNVF